MQTDGRDALEENSESVAREVESTKRHVRFSHTDVRGFTIQA